MPLPDRSITWPPAPIADLLPVMDEWAAWYTSDTAALTATYQGSGTRAKYRPSQFAGGVVGTVARWFWGTPSPEGQARPKLHIPLAGDIASASAELLFGESIAVTAPEGIPDTQHERLQAQLERIGWDALLVEAADPASGLGGVYLRVLWDTELADQPLIDVVQPDQAWPVFRHGVLQQVTFWTILPGGGTTEVWRLLEQHAPGRIEYGLYRGTREHLGNRVPLPDHPDAEPLAATVDADSGIATGHSKLTAVYVPNIRPARGWRSHGTGRHLGRADAAEAFPILDALDETYTSWMRDLRLAKGRVIAPAYMLDTPAPGQPGAGAVLDLEREVFTTLNMPPADAATGSQLTVQQFAIRTTEHAATARDLVVQALRSCGYSAQTFGYADEAAATATEVSARERRTASTREKKTRYWTAALGDLLEAYTAVDAAAFGGPGSYRPDIEFPATAQPSPVELATTAQLLKAAQAASIATRVRLVHPDWNDDDVNKEAQAILDEEGLAIPDLGAPLPGDGDLPGQADPEQLREQYEALGIAIRSGVDPQDAAARLGLSGTVFTGAVPTSLRLPQTDAAGLEQG